MQNGYSPDYRRENALATDLDPEFELGADPAGHVPLDLEAEFASPLDRPAPAPAPAPDVAAMLAGLESSVVAERGAAARAFCELQDARAVPGLIRLLSDACPLVRVSAAYGLGRNPDPRAVEVAIAALAQEWNGYVRKGLVWALGNSGDRRALEPLVASLQGDIAAVRLWAASALGQLGSAGYAAAVGAVPPLIVALRGDAIAAVRSNCAWSLGQLCRDLPANAIYAGAVDGLIEALVEDEEVGLKEDARSALLRLGDPRALQIIEELEREGWL